jgi:hypothetical protein
LARKDFGLNDGRRLIAMTRRSYCRSSEEQTFSHYKAFVAVSNYEQTNAQ